MKWSTWNKQVDEGKVHLKQQKKLGDKRSWEENNRVNRDARDH